MRDIKFRAFSKQSEIMYYPEANQDEFNHYLQIGSGGFWLYNKEGSLICASIRGDILMQFTGLKGYKGEYKERRNNEVDLYEGDIVEAMSEGSKGTFIIAWRQESSPCYILFPAWQSQKMWHIHASCLLRKDSDYYDDLKLIGNIYENAELNPLKGERINTMQSAATLDPGTKQAEATEQENAQESEAQDKAMEATQDSEEGSTEG